MEMYSSLFNNENQHPAPEQEITKVVEHVNGNQGNNKRRKRVSKVWEEMTQEIRDGKKRALCKHCEKEFDGSSKSGTTHLKNHLERCRRKRNGGEDPDKSMKTSDVIEEKSLIDLIKNFDEEGFPTKHLDPSVLNSRKVDILQIYEEEKKKLSRFFSQLSCRFSLRIEDFYGCCLLTAHYIDENWEPNWTIINFLNGNHGSRSVIATLKELCLDLKNARNICSVVVGNVYGKMDEEYSGYVTDEVNGEIYSGFTQQGSLPFGGFPVVMHNRFIDDAIVKTVNSTKKCDATTAALQFMHSFRNGNWFETSSTTPNMCFSKFCDLYVKLQLLQNTSPDEETFLKVSMLRKVVDIYWSKYNLVLVITAILDPRFKMDIVELWYDKIYGHDADRQLDKIYQDFKCVYNEYARDTATYSISYLDAMGRPRTSSHNLISPQVELDRYLNEPKFPSVEKFDILVWWRLYSRFFPTLARMARDFLAIPTYFSISLGCFDRIVSIIDDDKLDDDLKSALVCLLGL